VRCRPLRGLPWREACNPVHRAGLNRG
jgi:hypothetical protein